MPDNKVYNRFDSDKDLPSLEDKVIFITGGTTGLGKVSVLALAKHNPAHIYFTGRNASRGKALIDEIGLTKSKTRLTFIECDFQNLASVKTGMKAFTHSTLDILMCSAGIMAKPPTLSDDGYEVQFAVNHIAHALVIKLTLPALLEAATQPNSDVRIVIVTSLGFKLHHKGGIDFEKLNTALDYAGGTYYRYAQSKLANILYAQELARRYPQLTTVSVHPGMATTELITESRRLDKAVIYLSLGPFGRLMTPEEGAMNQLWMAAGAKKEDILNGAIYLPAGVESNKILTKEAKSEELAGRLWKWSQDVLVKY